MFRPARQKFAIQVEVPRIEFEKLNDERASEPSAIVRERVETARALQRDRFAGTNLQTNTDIGDIPPHCPVDAAGRELLKTAMTQLHLSPRAYHRILKPARTMADLIGSEAIEPPHLAEAIQYRPRQQV